MLFPLHSQRWRGFALTFTAMLALQLIGVVRGENRGRPWKAPTRAANSPNPIRSDDRSLAVGKTLFAKECMTCHGESGKGNGPDAADLSTQPPDFAAPAVAEQSDGELFWKMTQGRKPMPSYARTLSEDDRWNLVNYIRSISHKGRT
jgi:mono/diheme cytochrome c family protein